jgi:cytochrome c oxidase cbb3-type subunit 4
MVELSTGMIRGLGTIVVFVAFVGLSLWVFSGKRSAQFAEARLLPFADEQQPDISEQTRSTRP